jgi:hypothetical protein
MQGQLTAQLKQLRFSMWRQIGRFRAFARNEAIGIKLACPLSSDGHSQRMKINRVDH